MPTTCALGCTAWQCATWGSACWSAQPSNQPVLSSPSTLAYAYGSCVAPGRYLGDYIAAATAPAGTLATMWTDTALGRPKETDL